ncbi:MAG: hypothetical protein PVJ43_13060 [Gemmatimonadales bacterium]|jgi:hypothetical protein
MTEKYSTVQVWTPLAGKIGGLLLVSFLFWIAANFALRDPLCCLHIALVPLIVASFRDLWIGRVLGWSGFLAQVAVLILG